MTVSAPPAHADLVERLDRLIRKGRSTIATASLDASRHLHAGATVGFQTQALVCLADIVGREHPYYVEFARTIADDPSWHNARRVEQLVAILESLAEDVVNGYLKGFVNLISADVFDDFFDMAEPNGYKDPAASLTGAVLEDGLRRISAQAGVPVGPRDDLTTLNNRCADRGVYSRLVQKSVAVWIAVRNSADHGQFGEYTDHDVESMLAGTRHFLGDRLR